MKIIKLEDEEINALMELMDAGIKTLGLSRVTNAAILIQKIQGAQEVPEEEPKLKEVKKS